MILLLQNGYPYPYPDNPTDEESDMWSGRAAGTQLKIDNVESMQWLHTLTISFAKHDSMRRAVEKTGWSLYSRDAGMYVLEAKLSAKDGYAHPAIVALGTAYCGFFLY